MPRAKQRTPALRDRVLQVAVELLVRDGPDGFTTRKVAEGAATSTPAVYELFGDKAGLVRAIVFEPNDRIAGALRDRGYQAVQLSGSAGAGRPAEVILVVEKRRRIPELLAAIRRDSPGAVYTISDVKSVYEGPSRNLQQRGGAGLDWLLSKRR